MKKEDKEKEIVICLDQDQPYNRFYKLTQNGRSILREVISLSKD